MSIISLDMPLATEILGESRARTLFQMLRKTGRVSTGYIPNASGRITNQSRIDFDDAVECIAEHMKSTHGNVTRHLNMWEDVYNKMVKYREANYV